MHLTKRLNSSSPTLLRHTTNEHLTEYDLAQYTVNRPQPQPQQNPTTQTERIFVNDTPNGSRKRDQLKKNTGANAPWGQSGNLKEGTSPEGISKWRRYRGQPTGAPPPPSLK
eukprot:scaffold20106_cov111-Isochrysis_galbana.AAC.8